MAGGAGAGKSTLINKFKSSVPDFELINPDKYVEDEDHPFHNNLARASSQVDDKDVPQAMSGKENFIWDTTASNANKLFGGTYRRKEVEGILNHPDYDTLMVMVYAHPIVSFLRNFNRDRKVPKVGVLNTWNNVYGNINRYKSELGDNLVLYQSDAGDLQGDVDRFNEAASSGKLKEYFEDLIAQDPDKYASTFRKSDKGLSPEELAKKEKQREKSKEQFNNQIQQLEDQFSTIQSQIDELGASDEEVISKVKSFAN
jgi:predicted kinase